MDKNKYVLSTKNKLSKIEKQIRLVFSSFLIILQNEKPDIRKNQCTLRVLDEWHGKNCNPQDPLVIIIPDFESFIPKVLRDFILILR